MPSERKIAINTRVSPRGVSYDKIIYSNLNPAQQRAYDRALANREQLTQRDLEIQAEFKTTTVIVPNSRHVTIEFSHQKVAGTHVHGLSVRNNGVPGHIEIHTDRDAGIQAVANELRSRASSTPDKPSFLAGFKELLTGGKERQEVANRIYGDKTIAGQSAPSGLVTNADMKAYRDAEKLGRSVAKAQSNLMSRQPNNIEIDSRSQIDAGDYTAEVARQTADSQHLPGVNSWFTNIGGGIFGGTTRETITLDTDNMSHWQAAEYRSHNEASRERDLRDSTE